ncbi:hypothetical protein [Halocatena marina]|uniref:hypothetical protein n=1 Tax=Halocatena marina TaxID=2934937 RepID=UPI0022245399|nr:hypothetical protein [Halocatena marina]
MPPKTRESKTEDPPSPSRRENNRPDDSQRIDTHHHQSSKTNHRPRTGSRSFRLGIGTGAILIVVGAALLLVLSLPGKFLPASIGSLGVMLLALGTLGIGVSGTRSV